MKTKAFLKVLFIHILINIIALAVFSLLNRLMIDRVPINILYITETIIVVLLYLILSRRFLKELPRKNLLNSIAIILVLNLFLGICGYLIDDGIFGLLLLIIYMHFNFGFIHPLAGSGYLTNLPDFLNFILLGCIPPLLLYLGSVKLKFNKREYK